MYSMKRYKKTQPTNNHININVMALGEELGVLATFQRDKMILPAPLIKVVSQADYNHKMSKFAERLEEFDQRLVKPHIRAIEYLIHFVLILLIFLRLIVVVQYNHPSRYYTAYGFLFLVYMPIIKWFVNTTTMQREINNLKDDIEKIFRPWMPTVRAQLDVNLSYRQESRCHIAIFNEKVQVSLVFHVSSQESPRFKRDDQKSRTVKIQREDKINAGIALTLDSDFEQPIDAYFSRKTMRINDLDII